MMVTFPYLGSSTFFRGVKFVSTEATFSKSALVSGCWATAVGGGACLLIKNLVSADFSLINDYPLHGIKLTP